MLLIFFLKIERYPDFCVGETRLFQSLNVDGTKKMIQIVDKAAHPHYQFHTLSFFVLFFLFVFVLFFFFFFFFFCFLFCFFFVLFFFFFYFASFR